MRLIRKSWILTFRFLIAICVAHTMLGEARRIASGKAAVYFKRHYKDGTTRPARVAVNAFVDAHIEHSAALTP